MSDPFRWGILGTGRINLRVLPGFRDAGHAIAVVGSRNAQRGRAHAAELGAERSGCEGAQARPGYAARSYTWWVSWLLR